MAIPRYDSYSYSSYGARWTNHEWLSELILYLIFKFAKSAGLIIFKLSMGLIIAFLIYTSVIKNTKSLCLRLIFITLSLAIISGGFAIRPQIFTYVFFTVLVFLIAAFENTENIKSLYSLPAIFLLWVNLHGGFIIGVGILLAYALFKISDKRTTKKLIFIIALSVLATFINPYGIKIWTFVLGAALKHRPYITEWGRVRFSLEYLNYFTFCLVAILSLLFSKRKRSHYEIFIILIALYFSFKHNRHTILFAILASMYMPKYITSFAGDWFVCLEKKFSQNIFISIFACLSLYLSLATFYRGRNLLAIEIPQDKFPINAVMFIKQNNITGNIFCSFNWSQMCIKELSETNKVFFDGRYETVYSDSLIQGYFDAILCKREYKEFLQSFHETDIMFLNRNEPLAKALSTDNSWIKVYSSLLAQIYLNNNKKNEKNIERFKSNEMIYPEEKLRSYYLDDFWIR
jgi:hypothetical protein